MHNSLNNKRNISFFGKVNHMINHMIHDTRIQNAKHILTTSKYDNLKILNTTHIYSDNIINLINTELKPNINQYKEFIDKQINMMFKTFENNNIINTNVNIISNNMKNELYDIFNNPNNIILHNIKQIKYKIKHVFKRNILILQNENLINTNNIEDKITKDMKIELKNELDKPIYAIKILLLIFFISTVILNHDTQFGNDDLSNNIGTFIIENFVVGIGALLPIIYIYYLRHKKIPTQVMLEVFCIGVVVNIFLQFGGFYTIAFNPNTTDKSYIEKLTNGYTLSIVIIPFILLILYLLLITFIINESDIDYGDNDTMYYIKFTSEIIFFTVSNTLPYFLIAMNRNCNLFRNDINKIVKNNIIVSLGVAAVRFALLHIVLQFSGVYRYELGL
jgi:hypothetical protein